MTTTTMDADQAAGLLCETDGEELEATADGVILWGGVRVAVVECDNKELAKLLAAAPALGHALIAMTRERDAYRKAKQENDERFMREREEARAERDALRAKLRWHDALVGVERVLFDCVAGDAPKEEGDRALKRSKTLKHYGKLITDARYDAGNHVYAGTGRQDLIAKRAGVALVDLSLVARGVIPPFDDATTRRICEVIGCDPQPLLDAAAKIEEVLR